MLTLFNANRNSRKAAASAVLCGERFKTPSTVKYFLFCTHRIKIASQTAARITLYACLVNQNNQTTTSDFPRYLYLAVTNMNTFN